MSALHSAPEPYLTETDRRPVAGRLLRADGSLMKVVRHGQEEKFGFQGSAA